MPVNKVRRRGSYAPLSAHYYKDDALLRAGEKAEVLFLRGLAFCADVLSDGEISDAQLQYVGLGLSSVRARARKLVDVGLWERVDGGYIVRSWLSWNKSRADILGDAKKDAARKGEQASELPFPPEPPPDDAPPDDLDSERNPNGHHAESGGSPNGLRMGSHARGSARAPSRATPGQGNSRTEPRGGPAASSSSSPVGGRENDAPPSRRRGPDPSDLAGHAVKQFTPRGTDAGTRRRLAQHCDDASAEGASWPAIEHGLIAWSKHPDCTAALLPSLITNAVKAEHGARHDERRTGTDSKTAGWAAVRDELAARQTGQVIQLPGSAS